MQNFIELLQNNIGIEIIYLEREYYTAYTVLADI
jgi:hypothetical protein